MLALLCALGAFALANLSDFELENGNSSTLTFHAGGADLSGTLVMPKNAPDAPIALLIHGDGPRDRFSDSGYLPLINALLNAGIGVFTWDKAGVGESRGDWLAQSMEDRADEAVAAISRVRQTVGPGNKIGLLGFSQGGWVIPRVANEVRPAFSVIVGGAVNWRRQGVYLTRQRMQAQGVLPASIDTAISEELKSNDAVFARPGQPAIPATRPDIEPRRFNFIARNYSEDSAEALKTMRGPVLAIWGSLDRNVDPIEDANDYKRAFAGHTGRRVVQIPDATHALLRGRWFDYQLESEWPKWKIALFMCLGRHAYEPGALKLIATWIKAQ
ncbi:hypothetical protein PHO31112_02768 [Pandoraea horticolens]|uniref:AB hydrolase-1 domain-containing protein n=1 Tax=Pandoraea horticolens TaxID=2508298 RepID=A0A5E4VRE3_9BURK|nr:alpha/beta hydrolase [Pandoraea horticolens]VVE13834.1 hypothetical protein PHO31112_02768 [Pandoraea horticolens]